MNQLQIAAAALLGLLSFAAFVEGGTPEWCDRYKITSVLTTGLRCGPTQPTNLNEPSDSGDAPSFNCMLQQGATVVSFSFTSTYDTTGLDSAGITSHQYTQRRTTLVRQDNNNVVGSAVLPDFVTHTVGTGTTGPSYLFRMFHDYTNGVTPETCTKEFTIYILGRAQDTVECNKHFISSVELPGLVCNRPLTGLTIRLSDGFDPLPVYATCVLPQGFAEISAKANVESDEGAVSKSRNDVNILYSTEGGQDFFDVEEPDPAVWPLFGARPPTIGFRLTRALAIFNPAIEGSCQADVKFKLVDTLPAESSAVSTALSTARSSAASSALSTARSSAASSALSTAQSSTESSAVSTALSTARSSAASSVESSALSSVQSSDQSSTESSALSTALSTAQSSSAQPSDQSSALSTATSSALSTEGSSTISTAQSSAGATEMSSSLLTSTDVDFSSTMSFNSTAPAAESEPVLSTTAIAILAVGSAVFVASLGATLASATGVFQKLGLFGAKQMFVASKYSRIRRG